MESRFGDKSLVAAHVQTYPDGGHKRWTPECCMLDMPCEVLLHMATRMLQCRDVEAWGSACRRLHHIARDEHVWRALFEREFGSLYAQGVPALSWQEGVGPDDPWPADAEAFWERTLRAHEPSFARTPGQLWPHCPADPRVPAPFAHMGAVGKGWRWLYMAHAPPRGTHRMATHHAVGNISVNSRLSVLNAHEHNTIAYWGDVSAEGLRHGYGVEIHTDGARVTCWIECAWHNDAPSGWRIVANARHTFCALATCKRRVAFRASHDTQTRYWGNSKRSDMHGVCLSIDKDGTRFEGVMRAGRRAKGTTTFDDGSRCGCEHDDSGQRHGRAVVCYPNGDAATMQFVHGEMESVIDFVCSRTCPDPLFADRRIAGLSWRSRMVITKPGWHDWAYWPEGDSEDARAFCQYATRGLIGWDASVRLAALDLMPRWDEQNAAPDG